ncbi:MAG: hypothetical protein C5B50_11005, partial [Verrucomicrobia bacterium]
MHIALARFKICKRGSSRLFGQFIFIVLALGTACALAGERQVIKGHVPAAVSRLQPIGHLAATNRLRLAIGLPLRNQDQLNKFLEDLYNPASPNYRKYLTPEQFTERFGPAQMDYDAVIAFAKTSGLIVTAQHPNRIVLDVEATAAQIERVFHVTLRLYQHPTESRTFFAPDIEPSVDLAIPILHIEGLDNYSIPHPKLVPLLPNEINASSPVTPDDQFKVQGSKFKVQGSVSHSLAHSLTHSPARPSFLSSSLAPRPSPLGGQGTNGTYAGSDFRAAYAPGVALTGSGQNVGLLQFDGFDPGDVVRYETNFSLPNVPLTVVPVDGGVSTLGADAAEVCLDIEMVISMAPGVSRIYVYEAPNPSPWADLLSKMANDNAARQLSCSWGGGGPDPTSEEIFLQMDAQGQTFFNASGDSDAFTGSIAFPEESTNIVQVGGTTLTTSGPAGSYISETVWNRNNGIGSSGGISTYYGIPGYQFGVSMVSNQGSTTFRNVPDVALTAENVFVFFGSGQYGGFGGTSCAAPLWAGFTALINQQAAAAAQGSVGFLNPALYALGRGVGYASSFHDITNGNNTSSSSPNQFYAVAGYDLCTGWGTPSGSNLINALTTQTAVLISNSFALLLESCTNGIIDAGETVTISFGLRNVGSAATTNLVATLLPGTGVLLPSAPQTYGALAAGKGTAAQSFSLITTGACGATVTANLQLQDGAAKLGSVPFTFRLGQLPNSFSQNFDAVAPPALPSGWTSSATNAQSPWVTTSASSDTTPNSAYSPDASSIGLNELDSPVIALPPGPSQLTFQQNYDLESGYDGGVLEIKIGSGAWTDILSAGGSFVSGGYVATLPTAWSNPLGGRLAWTGTSGTFITTSVNLPAAAAGQPVQFRWRCGTDSSFGNTGWYVDSINISSSTYLCCYTPPSITTQPQGQTASLGSNPAFSVFAAGSYPFAYQWQFNGTNIPGATASSYTRTNAQTTNAGSYSVVVTNGGGSITSSNAVLTIISSPFIITQPTNVTTGLGLTANFAVNATAGGEPIIYQWRFNNAAILGASSGSFTVTNVQMTNAGSYSVLVTNSHGTTPSSNAVLTVLDPFITSQPQNQFVSPGGTALFNVTAIGTSPFGYQWKKNGTSLSDGAQISGAHAATLTVSNVQTLDTGTYAVLVSDPNGSLLSSNATLLGPFPPVIVTQPTNQTGRAGSAVSFGVGAAGPGPINYQWQQQGANITNGLKFSGVTNATLTISNAQGADAWYYSVIVSNSYGATVSTNALLSLWPMVSWGSDSSSQADIPPGISNVIAIACGGSHELALFVNHTMAAWGAGSLNTGVSPNFGQAIVPPGLTNVIGLAGGGFHTVALKGDGTVLAWGLNTSGQTNVPAGLNSVAAVSAGTSFSLALKINGSVVAWGQNTFGQSTVPAGLTNVISIAGGGFFAMALRSDGSVVAWGRNNLGQTNIPPGLTNAIAIAAGNAFAAALRSNGTVLAWGANDSSQTNVPPGLSNVVAIACGTSHVLALKSDGTLIAWGSNTSGQTNIPPGLTNVVAIAANGSDNLVLEGPLPPPLPPHIDAITRLPSQGFVLQVSGGPGHFALDVRPTFSTTWTQLTSLTTYGALFQFTDSQTNQSSRFYR